MSTQPPTEIINVEVVDGAGADTPTRPIPIVITGRGPLKPRRRMFRFNAFAVAGAAVLATTPLFWWTLLPVPLALVFAHVARHQIRRTGQRGAQLAKIVLILGYVLLALVLVGFVGLFAGSVVSFLHGPHGFGIEVQ